MLETLDYVDKNFGRENPWQRSILYDMRNLVMHTRKTEPDRLHYNPDFGCDEFLRIIDWMPYIVEMDFEEQELIHVTELTHIEKEFKREI